MNIVDIPLGLVVEPVWNPNRMDEAMMARLERSMERFGVVMPLVVRAIRDGEYETVGGAQRLHVLRRLRHETVPCVVVEADDAHAQLLSQALNLLHGDDDIGLRAELVRGMLSEMTVADVMAILPDTAESIKALVSMSKETIAERLSAWEKARRTRLHHLIFHLTGAQLAVVHEALERLLPDTKRMRSSSPSARGTALYVLCRSYLEQGAVR